MKFIKGKMMMNRLSSQEKMERREIPVPVLELKLLVLVGIMPDRFYDYISLARCTGPPPGWLSWTTCDAKCCSRACEGGCC